ncbi:ankyrin repeat domain-containing protein [Cryobacterium sp. PH29-G1]|uniref:ankyrin repeat domain-containing protein n=1 Tax=Cryobacterium sp. PH29-G1 TaxID=3046211 RepID=UPI0024BACF4F|nr:ankyrin repeat domain-containing protein [Cryobacterium sp. PH29-G1]MDJ0349707.1 ankyrin repeat domain-containing protein [Cryobacterium sp. PH29-G1]
MNENTSGPSPEVMEGVFDLARDGRTGPLGEMIDAGFGLDLVNARGDTLLIVAAYQQHPETVAELLRRGADASTVNAMGQTAISCAVFRNNEGILRLLLEADADPRLGTHSGVAIADQFGLPLMREIIESYPRA